MLTMPEKDSAGAGSFERCLREWWAILVIGFLFFILGFPVIVQSNSEFNGVPLLVVYVYGFFSIFCLLPYGLAYFLFGTSFLDDFSKLIYILSYVVYISWGIWFFRAIKKLSRKGLVLVYVLTIIMLLMSTKGCVDYFAGGSGPFSNLR